jgi:hypothetical protein
MRSRTTILISLVVLLILLLAGVFLLVRNAGQVLKYKLEQAMGKGFSVEKLEVTWRSVEAFNAVFRKPDGTTVFKADHVLLLLDLKGALKKEFHFSSVVLTNPYLLIETDRQGAYRNPFEGDGGRPSGAMPLISIVAFTVRNGSIDFSDGKIARPPLVTRLRNIEFELKDIGLPLRGTASPFIMEAAVPGAHGAGTIQCQGKINLKTLDLESTVVARTLDITEFKTYFQKKGDANVTGGVLDLDMKAAITSGSIKAPGRAVLKNLEFQSSGTMKDSFLGVPRSAVMGLLKNENNAITINFILEGDIRDPKFNLRESFLQKFTLGLAEKLGLSVSRIGESIVVEGAKQVEKGVKGIGEGIQKIFK